MKHPVRLISIDGVTSYITYVENPSIYAIIFENRVFLFFSTIADVQHFREVKAERTRHVEICAPVIPK